MYNSMKRHLNMSLSHGTMRANPALSQQQHPRHHSSSSSGSGTLRSELVEHGLPLDQLLQGGWGGGWGGGCKHRSRQAIAAEEEGHRMKQP